MLKALPLCSSLLSSSLNAKVILYFASLDGQYKILGSSMILPKTLIIIIIIDAPYIGGLFSHHLDHLFKQNTIDYYSYLAKLNSRWLLLNYVK